CHPFPRRSLARKGEGKISARHRPGGFGPGPWSRAGAPWIPVVWTPLKGCPPWDTKFGQGDRWVTGGGGWKRDISGRNRKRARRVHGCARDKQLLQGRHKTGYGRDEKQAAYRKSKS